MSDIPSSTSNATPRELELSDPNDVLTYLADTPFASTRAESLTGGNANFVFRLHLAVPFEGRDQTLVLKHAKPWIPMDKTIKFAVERQEFEAMALRHVRAFLPADALVTVPALHHYDSKRHVLIMEDCGPHGRTLKEILRDADVPLSPHAARALGTALGRFLAVVHTQGSSDVELLNCVARNEEGKRLSALVTYGRLAAMLKGEGESAGLVEPPIAGAGGLSEKDVEDVGALASETIQAMLDASTVFTMGDFWTGNIMVHLGDGGQVERAYVVDWEVAKPGLPFLDFGQFVAEMHTLRRCHSTAEGSVEEALSAYAKAYRKEMGTRVDDEYVRGAAAHIGAHLAVWTPRVSTWGPKNKVREIVREGAEYLLRSRRGDMEWLKTSVVDELFAQPDA
ncbi:hypothetical protein EW145_g4991 [Phellinidium pouzarii]|uniref:Aminoglycoside phosphotransferase domain-containing protein n=1 Tax=Phellinidium pouzarii TaxID=167371 RepID=A0A4S4L1J7_9AGAM|nr:hypothetical protein EW145_g4991 [Phellinidium pouzarii]